MTRDRARKKAIRARMAVSGEPYSVAARTLTAAEPGIGDEAVRELIVRVNRTRAVSSARIEVRVDNEIILAERPERRRPGPAGRLARAAWKGIASTRYATRLRDMFLHHVAEGFIEPAAGRYMIDWGGSAEMGVDGKRSAASPDSHCSLVFETTAYRPPQCQTNPWGCSCSYRAPPTPGTPATKRCAGHLVRCSPSWPARARTAPSGSTAHTSGGSSPRNTHQVSTPASQRLTLSCGTSGLRSTHSTGRASPASAHPDNRVTPFGYPPAVHRRRGERKDKRLRVASCAFRQSAVAFLAEVLGS